jgi:aryl-alcohol dehydrogenase-like predicted oxidoreductase
VDSLQPPYSLLWRHAERELLPFCRAHGIAVLAYSPLAQGLLTGKIGPDHRLAEGDNRRDNRLFQPPLRERAHAVVEAMRPLAAARGITLAQLALAWVAGQPDTAAIAGARTPAQVRENAAAGDVILEPELRARLDALGPERWNLAQNDERVMWTWST